jgi:sugar transport protein
VRCSSSGATSVSAQLSRARRRRVVVSFTFLPIAKAIGQGETCLVFAAVCAFAFAFANRYVPETKGLTRDKHAI